FRNSDLREIAKELGENPKVERGSEEWVTTILRALCFNMLEPPSGMRSFIEKLDSLRTELHEPIIHQRTANMAITEAGKILERMLKDLLQLYSYLFFGPTFEEELVKLGFVAPRGETNSLGRATIGKARDALERLCGLAKRQGDL